MILVFFVLCCV